MPTNNVMLSVSQVCALAPGDEQNASWINPGFSGVVNQITNKTYGGGKTMYVCIIGDVNKPDMVEMTLFKPTPFKEGDLIDVRGKGLRRTEYQGKAQVSVGKETQFAVSGGRKPALAPPTAARPAQTPRNDTRGGGDSHPDLEAGKSVANGFHPMMQAYATLYLHAMAYARKINTTLKDGGHPVMSEGQFQACVSTLYINADRAGLSMNPPPLAAKASAAPALAPKPAAPLADEDEGSQVPF